MSVLVPSCAAHVDARDLIGSPFVQSSWSHSFVRAPGWSASHPYNGKRDARSARGRPRRSRRIARMSPTTRCRAGCLASIAASARGMRIRCDMAMHGAPRSQSRRPNGSRTVFCGIADALVVVSRRNGSGLQEPIEPYVRCEERDCQYVDVNEPPCPLRLDMFRDRADDVVQNYLMALGGAAICDECLSCALDIPPTRVRISVRRLAALSDSRVEAGVRRCARCSRRRWTATAADSDDGGRHEERPDQDLVAALLRAPQLAFCSGCLAAIMNDGTACPTAIASLARIDCRIASGPGRCSRCRRVDNVLAGAAQRAIMENREEPAEVKPTQPAARAARREVDARVPRSPRP